MLQVLFKKILHGLTSTTVKIPLFYEQNSNYDSLMLVKCRSFSGLKSHLFVFSVHLLFLRSAYHNFMQKCHTVYNNGLSRILFLVFNIDLLLKCGVTLNSKIAVFNVK